MAHLFTVSLRLDVSPSWRFPLQPRLINATPSPINKSFHDALRHPDRGHSSRARGLRLPFARQRRGRLGPAKSGKSVSPGNRVRGEVVILDQWTHLPTLLSAPARREERERAGAHPGHLTTRLGMSGWVWMPLQTDAFEADRPQTGGMRRWKHFPCAGCCQTNKRL